MCARPEHVCATIVAISVRQRMPHFTCACVVARLGEQPLSPHQISRDLKRLMAWKFSWSAAFGCVCMCMTPLTYLVLETGILRWKNLGIRSRHVPTFGKPGAMSKSWQLRHHFKQRRGAPPLCFATLRSQKTTIIYLWILCWLVFWNFKIFFYARKPIKYCGNRRIP